MVSSLLAVASDKEEWALASEDCATDANTFPIMNVTERLNFCWYQGDDYGDAWFQDVYFNNGTIVHIDAFTGCSNQWDKNLADWKPHSAPTREEMGNCVFDDREFVTVLQDYTPEGYVIQGRVPLKKGMRGVVVSPNEKLRGPLIKVEGIFPEQFVSPHVWSNTTVINIEQGNRVDCSLSVPARFQECCQSGKKFCHAARVDALECATCTPESQDPWSKGYEVACCYGLHKVLWQNEGCGYKPGGGYNWCYNCQDPSKSMAPQQGDVASWDGEVIV